MHLYWQNCCRKGTVGLISEQKQLQNICPSLLQLKSVAHSCRKMWNHYWFIWWKVSILANSCTCLVTSETSYFLLGFLKLAYSYPLWNRWKNMNCTEILKIRSWFWVLNIGNFFLKENFELELTVQYIFVSLFRNSEQSTLAENMRSLNSLSSICFNSFRNLWWFIVFKYIYWTI